MPRQLEKKEFIEELRSKLLPHYIDKHPLMKALYSGRLTKKQIQAWVINRFYFMRNVAIKDAAILSNCPEQEVRKIWISRALRREGIEGNIGDIDGWLEVGEAVGIKKEVLLRAKCLPGVRFAVNDLINFARKSSWQEGISVSLYELLAKDELAKRIEAFKRYYGWAKPNALKFFLSRLSQLDDDIKTTIELVMKYCNTWEMQRSAIGAALYMGEVVWSMHDSIYMAYVIEDRPLSDSI